MQMKKPLIVGLVLIATMLGLISQIKPPTLAKTIHSENSGDIVVTEPMWGSQGLTLVFADTGKFAAGDLGQRLAATGVTSAVVDARQFFKGFSTDNGLCLDNQNIADAIAALVKQLPPPSVKRLIVAGLGEGALIPFIHALSASGNDATNLSIGFSVALPNDLALCPPLLSRHHNHQQWLTSAPVLEANWRSVWTDQPDDETAVFIRTLENVDTRIAAYDTPLDELLIEEIKVSIGLSDQSAPPMPVVEVPAGKPSDTVTLFYSGDGGWRDLDRTVAGEMAGQNYPVVGVDVLRYFWEHKTADQAAADLAATMAYYRKHWHVKSFVLAGYSFGADILPAVYNRLPQPDRDSVALLALIALADHADFEIHVAGWLGRSGGEHLLAPELAQIPKTKILCIYGKDEKAETACTKLGNGEAAVLELPGGHHFDQDYPKLTRQILDVYRRHGIH